MHICVFELQGLEAGVVVHPRFFLDLVAPGFRFPVSNDEF